MQMSDVRGRIFFGRKTKRNEFPESKGSFLVRLECVGTRLEQCIHGHRRQPDPGCSATKAAQRQHRGSKANERAMAVASGYNAETRCHAEFPTYAKPLNVKW